MFRIIFVAEKLFGTQPCEKLQIVLSTLWIKQISRNVLINDFQGGGRQFSLPLKKARLAVPSLFIF